MKIYQQPPIAMQNRQEQRTGKEITPASQMPGSGLRIQNWADSAGCLDYCIDSGIPSN